MLFFLFSIFPDVKSTANQRCTEYICINYLLPSGLCVHRAGCHSGIVEWECPPIRSLLVSSVPSQQIYAFLTREPSLRIMYIWSRAGMWFKRDPLHCNAHLPSLCWSRLKRMVEINFLCVHKKLRSKRVAPVLIREITRRVNIEGIFQAVYTAGVVLPKPVSTCRYAMQYPNVDHFKPVLPNSLLLMLFSFFLSVSGTGIVLWTPENLWKLNSPTLAGTWRCKGPWNSTDYQM